jgi:hypothetical protein
MPDVALLGVPNILFRDDSTPIMDSWDPEGYFLDQGTKPEIKSLFTTIMENS